ncbi:TPA: hypothetical protein ACGU7V_004617, partial [Vibrio vulnificus]
EQERIRQGMARTRKSEKSITAKRRFFNPTENHVDTNNDERREYDSTTTQQTYAPLLARLFTHSHPVLGFLQY